MQFLVEVRFFKFCVNFNEVEMYFGFLFGCFYVDVFQSLVFFMLGIILLEFYLGFFLCYDGLVVVGVFFYLSILCLYCDGGLVFVLVEMNFFVCDQGFMGGYVEFGESDMDCYVFEFVIGWYQVCDKVVFDNVYEEFILLDGLFGYIIGLIEQYC